MRGDGFQTQKQKSWVSGQVRAARVLADAITIDGRKERICKFCSETNVWTRWRCRRCGNNIPTGLQGKHKQAVYAKNEGWCSGSSSSSGGEEGKSQDQDEEIEKMRAHVELLRKQVFECGATQTEHFIQPMQPEFYRRFKAPDALEQRAGGEREEDWDDEKAANGWYESATVGSAVQPAGC